MWPGGAVGGEGGCNDGGGVGGCGAVRTGGLRRVDRRRGVCGVRRPGVLRLVVRLCRRGVCWRVRGAVGLLDSVGSTLGGGAAGISTLGDC